MNRMYPAKPPEHRAAPDAERADFQESLVAAMLRNPLVSEVNPSDSAAPQGEPADIAEDDGMHRGGVLSLEPITENGLQAVIEVGYSPDRIEPGAPLPIRSRFAPPAGAPSAFGGEIPVVTLADARPVVRYSQAGLQAVVRGAR